jgi:RNA polymerase sigma-70 factor (ECF subfamily)
VRLDIRREDSLDTVVRARSGDVDAFEELVRRHAPSAYRLAAAIVGESRAQDIVQDAFLRAWRAIRGLRDAERFEPWLHRIVANSGRSALRAERRVREVALDASTVDVTAPGDGLGGAEARAMVGAAFRRLSPDHRVVIGLHYGAGLSIGEVAEVLGLPVGTAKSRLAAALVALRADVGAT